MAPHWQTETSIPRLATPHNASNSDPEIVMSPHTLPRCEHVAVSRLIMGLWHTELVHHPSHVPLHLPTRRVPTPPMALSPDAGLPRARPRLRGGASPLAGGRIYKKARAGSRSICYYPGLGVTQDLTGSRYRPMAWVIFQMGCLCTSQASLETCQVQIKR